MPATRTPRSASGTAILPVPIASSSAPPLAKRKKEVDDRLDRHAGRRLVVALRDVSCEPVGHPDLFSFPCRFACRSPTRKTARPIGVASTAMISSGQTSAQTRPVP